MQIFSGGAKKQPRKAAALELPAECVGGFAVIVLSGFQNRLGPFAVMDGIGIELSLQGNTLPETVMNAALTHFIQVVAGVELNTGAVGGNGHFPAGTGVPENGAGGAEYLPIVVKAAL